MRQGFLVETESDRAEVHNKGDDLPKQTSRSHVEAHLQLRTAIGESWTNDLWVYPALVSFLSFMCGYFCEIGWLGLCCSLINYEEFITDISVLAGHRLCPEGMARAERPGIYGTDPSCAKSTVDPRK